MKINNIRFNKNKHQIFIGVTAVLSVVVLSVSVVLASPTEVSAQVAPPCCFILPPPPPPIPPPILPIPLPPKSVSIPQPVQAPATVVVKKEKPKPVVPTCTLSASPTSITSGGSASLLWNTTNANSFSINNGIGSVSNSTSGTKTVSPLAATTYTGTAVGAGGTATCSAEITIKTPPPPPPPPAPKPVCALAVSPTSIASGGSATLTWGGRRMSSAVIGSGIGSVSTSGSVSVSPAVGTHKYTGTFEANNGNTLTCSATLTVTSGGGGGGGGGCTGNCGGGHVTKLPTITLTQLNKPSKQPLAFVYLSQIPYTGLDLGIFGTVIYWSVLIIISLISAYFVLFFGLPLIARKLKEFAGGVKDVLNEQSSQNNIQSDSVVVEEKNTEQEAVSELKRSEYSKHEGFRSFAQEESALTVGDIVKGLSRSTGVLEKIEQSDIQKSDDEKGIIQTQDMIQKIKTENQSDFIEETETIKTSNDIKQQDALMTVDTKDFLSALLNGDRVAVFAMVKQISRGGGDVERLISDATCVLDDVYRSRTDGSVCDSDIVRLSAKYQTPILEKLITALTTSIDSSYSSKQTAVKISLIRALSSIGA